MDHKQFYINLGKLLYSIANADGKIQPKETEALKKILRSRFVPIEVEADEFGMNDAYYAEFEFETSQEIGADVEAAFDSFIDFIREHRTGIDASTREACIITAEEVARSFHNMNKKEAYYISRLKQELKKI